MKIFKSIKWRLQLWYGLILVLVLAGFGFTAYQLEYNRQMLFIDAALQHRFDALVNALHPPPGENGQPRNHPPFDQLPDGELRGQNPPPEFHLRPQDLNMFKTNDTPDFYFSSFYFAIQTRDGKELAHSEKVPSEINVDKEFSEWRDWQTKYPHPSPAHVIEGNFREMFHVLPRGEAILVGCSIVPEMHDLHLIALKLAGAGLIILLVGLIGGNWLVSRAFQPIENISTTAAKISAGDLSQRINIAETESELGKLAAVLNSTFARLDAAFAQQKQFASDAAHELRTPVTVILTQTQTALNREREARDYKETVEACQRAAQRMKKLISALLELARLDAGQEKLKQLQFDFARTIGDCVELIMPLANDCHVKIIPELAPLQITGDSERLAQVVTNLLTNAIQYNREGGEVRLNLKSENGMAVLTVSDTGHGIPAEDLPRVFERFHRADKSRTGANAGLGLAICKAIVAAHSGTIEVSSKEDVGTTFTMRLPI